MLTGLTDALVAPAPRIEAVLPSLLEFLRGTILVGHNIGFDVAFLRNAFERAGHPRFDPVRVDTVALARRLVRDEVPDCRLGTLASRFRLDHKPTHRALDDALATTDLLHLLIERATALGVLGIDDLTTLASMAGHPQAAKLKLTSSLPRSPGVYLFCGHRDEVLYVGKATNLRQRVRSYFGREDRRRIGPMLREAQAVRHHCLPDPLSAEVVEARLIARLKPRYNRAGTRADRYCYVRLDVDSAWPRLAIVRDAGAHRRPPGAVAVADDGDAGRRGAAGRAAAAALLGPARAQPRRRRRVRRRARRPRWAWPRARAPASPSGAPTTTPSAPRSAAMTGCGGPVAERLAERMRTLAAAQRFEEAAMTRDRMSALDGAVTRTRQMDDLLARGRFETTRGDVTWVVDHARLVDVRVAGSTAGALPAAPPPAPEPGRPLPRLLADEALVLARRLPLPDATTSAADAAPSLRAGTLRIRHGRGQAVRSAASWETATMAARAPAALPLSIDCSAIARPAGRSSAAPPTTSAAAALSTTMSRWAPRSPSSTRRTTSALCSGSPPTSWSWVAGARPSATGSTVNVRAPPSWWRASTVDGPVVVSSSSPPPWTTHASVDPWARSDASMRSAKRASATPMIWRRTRPGLAIGPSRLNTVGIPISRRDGAAKRNAGWNRGAKQKPIPASSTQRCTPSGVSSSTTPSASSTSAVPHSDDAPRAPCLHTGTPAPATTIAAIVETLIECERSPPVPTTSTARARRSSPSGTSSAAASTASSSPDSSSAVSPLARRATTKPISWAGVALPPRIVAIAARAWSAVRSRPASSSVSSPGQPP